MFISLTDDHTEVNKITSGVETIKIEDEKDTKNFYNFSTATTTPIMSTSKSSSTVGISALNKSLTPRRSKHEVRKSIILMLLVYNAIL